MSHIRDQGKCGSCWAQAAANTLDAQLCITSGGRFNGGQAWTSAGYMTSFYASNAAKDGCQGGDPLWAIQKATQTGVPSGGPSQNSCVPYFTSGGSLSHFFQTPGSISAPQCPSQCTTDRGYPRSLAQDKFKPGLLTLTRTTDVNAAKIHVYNHGPIPMTLKTYDDLLAYKSGFYHPTSSKIIGGHATTMLGWTVYAGKNYIVSANSWGTSWGEGGFFKIDST